MTVKIDIVSGFLGAGKTTLINRFMGEAIRTDSVAVIENEFGEINIDGQILADSGITIREISGGCICCTLFGDFVAALGQLLSQYPLTRVIVEPTGIGQLSDVIKACRIAAQAHKIDLNMLIAVVDCLKYDMYSRMFGEFFFDQIQHARTIFLSRTQMADADGVETVVKQIEILANPTKIVSLPWDEMSGAHIISLGEKKDLDSQSSREDILESLSPTEGDFQVWNRHTARKFTPDQIRCRLEKLGDRVRFGLVVRGKGILRSDQGGSLRFDYVPGEVNLKATEDTAEGKIVVIGTELKRSALEALFSM